MAVEDSLVRYLRLGLSSMYVKAAKITRTNVSASNVSIPYSAVLDCKYDFFCNSFHILT